MSSQQLLRETQRAAGDENLTKWHDTLISAGKDLRQLQQVGSNHHLIAFILNLYIENQR